MSRKRSGHQPTTNRAWPLLAFGGILILTAVFVFARQGGGGGDRRTEFHLVFSVLRMCMSISVKPARQRGFVPFGR